MSKGSSTSTKRPPSPRRKKETKTQTFVKSAFLDLKHTLADKLRNETGFNAQLDVIKTELDKLSPSTNALDAENRDALLGRIETLMASIIQRAGELASVTGADHCNAATATMRREAAQKSVPREKPEIAKDTLAYLYQTYTTAVAAGDDATADIIAAHCPYWVKNKPESMDTILPRILSKARAICKDNKKICDDNEKKLQTEMMPPPVATESALLALGDIIHAAGQLQSMLEAGAAGPPA